MAKLGILLLSLSLCLTDAQEPSICFSSNNCRGNSVESEELQSTSDCCAGLGLSYTASDGSCSNCFSEEAFINEGDEYSLAAFNNVETSEFFRFGRIRLSVCPINVDTATFTVRKTPSNRQFETLSAPTVFIVEGDQRTTNSGERDKRIRIKAENGEQLSVIALAEEFTSSDSFKVLPMVNLPNDGYEYYGVSVSRTQVPAPDSNDTVADPEGNSVMLIVTTEDNTVLSITATSRIDLSEAVDNDLKEVIDFNFLEPGETLNIVFGNAGQTLYLGSLSDITGSRVVSNKPIAFFSGHECGTIPSELLFCDQIVEQIPPTATWGKTFITVPFANRDGFDIFKIIASRDNTVIRSRCDDNFQIRDIALNAGEVEELSISSNSSCYFESSNPVLLVQFSVSVAVDDAEEGDPFMVVIPPVEQYRSRYIVTAFEAPSDTLGANGTHFINIMLPGDFDPSAVLLDGEQLSPEIFSSIPCIDDSSTCAFGAQIIDIAIGDHTIAHRDESARLNVVVYWQSSRVAQGYPGGMTQRPIALPAVNFTSESFQMFENATAVTLRLTRAGDSSIEARVNIRTIEVSDTDEEPARVGEDFETLDTTVVFAEGVTEMVAIVPLVDDVFPEMDEVFEVYLAASPGVYITSPSIASVTILNDDPELPVMNISFVDTEITAREGVGVIQFVLRKTEGAVGPVSVTIFTEEGSANSVDDFVGIPNVTVTFEIEDLEIVITTLILDNLLVEEDEEFRVFIEAIGGIFPVNVEDGEAVVTVVDNDVAVIGFNPVNYVVVEGESAVEVTIEMLFGRLERDLVIEMSFINDSAQAGSDFIVPTTTLLTFGPTTTQIRQLIPIIDDPEVEETELFLLTLLVDSGDSFTPIALVETREIVLASSEAQVMIEDNDEAVIVLSAVRERAREGAAGPRVGISILGTIGVPVEVELTTFNQNATAGDDYIGIANMLVTLTNESSSQEVIIDIIDDGDYEGPEDESFIAQICLLSGNNNGITIGISTIELIIEDNDPRPVPRIGFMQAVYSVVESSREVLILLESDGLNQQPVQVSYTTAPGSATSADFEATSGTATFQAGSRLQSFTIQIINDGIAEPTESFTVQLQSGGDSDISQGTTEVRIQDEDSVVIGFNPTQYIVQENVPRVSIVITRSTEISIPVSVVFSTLEATADGSDFDEVADLEVTFQPNGSPTQRVDVDILDDSINEGAELFNVRLKPSEGDTIPIIIEEPLASVIIEDNDPAPVVTLRIRFSQGAYIFDENVPTAIIAIAMSEASSEPITVLLATLDGSASETDDYLPFNMVPITFAPFETDQTIELVILDDEVLESDEDFSVILVNNGTGATLDSATVIIENDDSVILEFIDTSYTVEEAQVATIEVRLVGTAALPVIATIATQDGTAEAPGDYAAVSVPVAFVPGEDIVRYSIAIQFDSVPEEQESFFVILSTDQDGVFILENAIVVVNDFSPLNLCESSPCDTNAVCTNTCGGVICTCLPGFTGDGFTCGCSNGDIRLVDGDNELEGRVEICFGEAFGTVCDDLWDTNDATVVCRQLGLGVQGAIAFGSATFQEGTGDIFLDDVGCIGTEQFLEQCSHRGIGTNNCDHSEDAGVRCRVPATARVQFNPTQYSVIEGEVAILRIELDGENTEPIRVEIIFVNDSAIAPFDYLDLSQIIEFGPGQGNREIFGLVPTNEDLLIEEEEVFLVLLGVLSDGVEVDDNPARVVIRDNTEATIGLERSMYTVTEDDEFVEVCAVLEEGVLQGVSLTVAVSTVDITAQADADYDAVDQTLTFAAGIDRVCVVIAIINDTTEEQDEMFFVNIITTEPRVNISRASSTVVIIDDDTVFRFEFEEAEYTFGEEDTFAVVCVVLTTGTVLPMPVPIGVQSEEKPDATNPATAGVDFQAAEGVSSTDGGRRTCYSYFIFEDDNREADEQFRVVFTNLPSGQIQIGTVSEACITILDNDGVTIGLERSMYNVTEGTPSVELCAILEEGTLEVGLIVEASTMDNTAQAGSDYSGVSVLLPFPAGATRQCGSITILNDAIEELTETFFVNISTTEPRVTISRASSTVVIIDDDKPCVDGDIRLRGGDDEFEGRVEVCLNEVFGTICDDSWDVLDGDVVCVSLFGEEYFGDEVCGDACFGQGDGPINLDNVDCSGFETSLLDCTIDLDTSDCSHREDAGVICGT